MAHDPPEDFIRSIMTGLVEGLRVSGVTQRYNRDVIHRTAKEIARALNKDGWELNPRKRPPTGGLTGYRQE